MSLAIRLAPETVRSLGFAAIVAGYTGIGTVFTRPSRIIILQNFTDADVMISLNGIDDHIPLATQSSLVLDVSSNKGVAQEFSVAQGTRFYVKQLSGAPSSGSVYVSTFYGAE